MCDIQNCELLKLKEDFGLVPNDSFTAEDQLYQNMSDINWLNDQFQFDRILVLNRDSCLDNAVLGKLYFRGVLLCYTLEPFDKMVSVGRYPLKVSYSPKFRCFTPELSVPGRIGIRIHKGNSLSDTKGCVLVGMCTDKAVIKFSMSAFDTLLYNIRNCDINTILISNNF